MPDAEHLSKLKKRLAKIRDVDAAAAVLEWDQETYMPPGAVRARAEQIATIRQIGHDWLT
ncbi:MAG: carboxypeptidase M32, partial [Rhodothermia bacterium]|nr:carboxypeptidase M32 [Rhodothermia bacterium]